MYKNKTKDNNIEKKDKDIDNQNTEETKGVLKSVESDSSENSEKPEAESKKNKILIFIRKLSKRWFIEAFAGMAQGLFVTLIAGTIISQIGKWIVSSNTNAGISLGKALINIGTVAKHLMGAGIGVGIARYLKCGNLVTLSSAVSGIIGAFSWDLKDNWVNLNTVLSGGPGNPIGAYVCALIGAELGLLVSGKTKIDILLVPLTVIFSACLATFVAWPFIKIISFLAIEIEKATVITPFVMGILIAVIVGLLLTLPTSSAAIWMSIATNTTSDAMLLAGGAACVGCCAHMIGFAVASYRENKFGGFIAQGFGTSMLQIPNLMKNPKILLPAIFSSAVVGPLSTTVFKLRTNATGGGMGTSGLVGIFGTIDASIGVIPSWQLGLGIVLLMFLLPGVISFLVSEILRKIKWIAPNDMKIQMNN